MDFPFGHLPIEIIDKYLQEGGGYSLPRTTPQIIKSTHVKKTLLEKGWKQRFMNTNFKNLNDDLLKEWPTDLFLQHYFQHLVAKTDFTGDLVYDLQSLGIKKSVAQPLGLRMELLKNTCYTQKQFLFFGIEILMGRYDPITPPDTTHLFFPDKSGQWIEIKKHDFNSRIYNVNQRCNLSLEPALSSMLRSITKEGHVLYYHATNWGSCLSILERIESYKGRPCLDFGKEPSFYLSTTLRDSLEWGQKQDVLANWNETGIIIFSLPAVFPKKYRVKKLQGKEWEEITSKSRRCMKIEDKSYYNYDFIEGNMVANVDAVESGEASVPLPHRPPKLQLASRNHLADKYLQKHIFGCIFFQKFMG
jgi:hypothetical protein